MFPKIISYPTLGGTSGPLVSSTHCIIPVVLLFVLSYSDTGEEAVVVGDGLGTCRACGLTMTWITKSFWILVSCSRVLSVSNLPEKNQRWWAGSISSWACSCFLSCPMVSAMLALRRRSLPVERRTYRRAGNARVIKQMLYGINTNITEAVF